MYLIFKTLKMMSQNARKYRSKRKIISEIKIRLEGIQDSMNETFNTLRKIECKEKSLFLNQKETK